ncbi:MAG: 50S ribosomal protein L15 [Holosporales bacterium]|jgi:large subunit ribosomal protein L15|nr:50S ribosomal protein L15 [Holosporales bacterium]
MSYKLNTIHDNPGALRVRKVVGRGLASGLGKTSGRGGKGQTARAGVSLNGFEGGQMPIYRRLPKRGFKSHSSNDLFELHFDKLKGVIAAGKVAENNGLVDASFLMAAGLMGKSFKGISLVAKGELNVPLSFVVTRVSKKAKELVEKAGGAVSLE